MKKRIWDIRIPTVFALVLVAVSIWITLYAVQKGVFIVGRAAPEKGPLNVTFGNITDSSLRVGFTTKEKVKAAVKLTDSNGAEQVLFDDRDAKGETTYYAHIFTFKNLKPSTKYTTSLLIEGQTFPQKNEKPLIIYTAPQISDEEGEPKAYKIQGTVLDEQGQKADDFLVVIELENAQTLLTLSVNGDYSFDFEKIRTRDLNSYFTPKDNTTLKLTAFQKSLISSVNASFKDSLSLPPIVFSQSYSLLESSPTPIESTPSSSLAIPTPNRRSSGALTITTPQQNQTFIDNQPMLRGTALPNKDVFISFEKPTPVTAKVLSDNLGFWTFRPATPLAQGQHAMSVESSDSFGIKQSVTRQFSIFASGSQITESATPSASPTLTIKPTATITPTLTALSPTPTTAVKTTVTPTVVLPTATFTPTPTFIQNTSTPTPFLSITPTSPGSVTSVLVTLVSVLFIITGTALLFILS